MHPTRFFIVDFLGRTGKAAQSGDTSSIVWLATDEARKYFEAINMSAEQALRAMDWPRYAEPLTERAEPSLRSGLRQTIDYLRDG